MACINIIWGINYLYRRHHDEAKERKEARKKLNATCHSVCFYLAMQQSELGGLLKDIEYRIKQLNAIKKTGAANREMTVAALQDFVFCKDININIDKISEVIFPAGNDQRGVVEILQCVFISNKKYFKILNTLERFNEAKRLINQEDGANAMPNLLTFTDTNLPQYQKEIAQNMAFILRSLEAFKAEVKEKFKIIVRLSVGDFIQLN